MIKAGQILLAEPFLQDPSFKRSVIMICEHNTKGSFGLVLNKPTDYTFSMIMESDLSLPVFEGGPVQKNTLHYLHTFPDQIPDSVDLGNNIYWSGDFEVLKDKLELGVLDISHIRFFLGYSGWGEGQLNAELDSGSWVISQTTADIIFETPVDKLWKNVLINMGGKYKIYANSPTEVGLN